MVVDDSAFMRKIIADLIDEDKRLEVVYKARDGVDALEHLSTIQPDVITMDIEMPLMNGMEALQKIMAVRPTPVIVLSTWGDTDTTIRALQLGAFDFVCKPSGSISLDLSSVKTLLIQKLLAAGKSEMKTLAKDTKTVTNEVHHCEEEVSFQHHNDNEVRSIVAIGASTGGPKALQQVLTSLPKYFPAPIVIVQHMPAKFTASLANRLNAGCSLHVKEAEQGEPLLNGKVYIAPGDYHMEVVERPARHYTIQLNQNEQCCGHRPSVDVLYESLYTLQHVKRLLVIMTGMGSDGAQGMKKLKQLDDVGTIAQSEETCVVYGMPRSAVRLDVVDHIVPLEHIASKISLFLK